jgi:hypothetical protein
MAKVLLRGHTSMSTDDSREEPAEDFPAFRYLARTGSSAHRLAACAILLGWLESIAEGESELAGRPSELNLIKKYADREKLKQAVFNIDRPKWDALNEVVETVNMDDDGEGMGLTARRMVEELKWAMREAVNWNSVAGKVAYVAGLVPIVHRYADLTQFDD